jgi:hypothetical protein
MSKGAPTLSDRRNERKMARMGGAEGEIEEVKNSSSTLNVKKVKTQNVIGRSITPVASRPEEGPPELQKSSSSVFDRLQQKKGGLARRRGPTNGSIDNSGMLSARSGTTP